jgi:hypothetical protein
MCIDVFAPAASIEVPFLLEQIWLPSYFWAMSRRYQAMTVSGVKRTVVCARSSRVSCWAFAASLL